MLKKISQINLIKFLIIKSMSAHFNWIEFFQVWIAMSGLADVDFGNKDWITCLESVQAGVWKILFIPFAKIFNELILKHWHRLVLWTLMKMIWKVNWLLVPLGISISAGPVNRGYNRPVDSEKYLLKILSNSWLWTS